MKWPCFPFFNHDEIRALTSRRTLKAAPLLASAQHGGARWQRAAHTRSLTRCNRDRIPLSSLVLLCVHGKTPKWWRSSSERRMWRRKCEWNPVSLLAPWLASVTLSWGMWQKFNPGGRYWRVVEDHAALITCKNNSKGGYSEGYVEDHAALKPKLLNNP